MAARIVAIAWSVVADALRRKVVYIVILFGIVMAAVIPSLPSYGAGIVESYFREVSLALTFVVALVVGLALAVNRIPGELERRTAYNILAKRVARWEYVAGSWLGVGLVLAGLVGAMIVIVQMIGVVVYHDAMWRVWGGALGVWLETSVLTAFAVALSTITGPVPVSVGTLAFLFFGHLRGYVVEAFGAAVGRFYPSLDTFNVINPVAHGSGVTAVQALVMLVVGVAWWVVLIAAGAALFRRRDL